MKKSINKNRVDEDEKALQAFIRYRDTYTVDYDRVNDEDVLVDAMHEAESLELKKLLMRYRRLKNEAQVRDSRLCGRILRNYFSCIRKVGVLVKKQESSFFDAWDSRFVVLTNAGLIYFKSEKLQTESDLVPQNFKPLNDFVVTKVNPNEVKGKPYCFRVHFHKDALMTKNLTLQAPSEQDMNEWIKSLRLHQIDLFRSRSSVFEQWLGKQGVKVPGEMSEAVAKS